MNFALRGPTAEAGENTDSFVGPWKGKKRGRKLPSEEGTGAIITRRTRKRGRIVEDRWFEGRAFGG